MAATTLPKLRVSREEAREKIEAQIEKGQWLHDQQISSDDELDQAIMESDNWSSYSTDLLIGLFDSSTPVDQHISFYYSRFSYEQAISRLDLGMPVPDFKGEVKEYRECMAHSISSLKGIHERVELYDEPLNESQHTPDNEESSDTPQHTFGNEVFIVHGHDDEAKVTVARFVENLGIEATILHEQANRGQTIPEKFEEHASEAGFAIILLTPDDVGASKDERDNLKPRARQNVVLELGYFWGRLGRERVCVLYKEEVELPSDMQGILYVPMDNFDGWKHKLAREMKQAELPVDLNKLA